jgi:hypothetical protein
MRDSVRFYRIDPDEYVSGETKSSGDGLYTPDGWSVRIGSGDGGRAEDMRQRRKADKPIAYSSPSPPQTQMHVS